jgi:hypothetical protein
MLVLTVGRCPAADGQAVVPGAWLATGKLSLGQQISTNAPGQPKGNRFVVAGGYDAVRAGPVLAELSGDAGVPVTASDPPVFVTPAVLTAFSAPVVIAVRSARVPARIDLDAVPAAEAGVELVRARVIAAQIGSVSFSSDLPDVLAAAAAGRRAATTLVFVTTAQGVGLALAGAIGVMALIARARTPEWALGRLRGLRRASRLGIVLAEPVALIGLGAVAGLLGGWAWCALAVRWVVPGGERLELLRAPVLSAAAIAAGGLLVAAVAASLRGARAPLATVLGQAAEPGRAGRFAVAAESTLAVLAVAAGSQLLLQPTLVGRAGTLALLAPGLIAAALALLAIRLATFLVRRRARGPVDSIAGLLVLRPLARTPSLLQRQLPVAVGVALLVFATQLAVISTRNQHLRAGAEVGAATVLQVAVPAGRDLRTLVRAADPSGEAAMAVQERSAGSDTGTSRVVAVDTGRLAAVSPWRAKWAGLQGDRLAGRLRPASAPAPLTVRGTRVSVGIGASDLQRSSTAEPTDPPIAVDLVLVVSAGGSGAWQRVTLGALDDTGSETMRAVLPCATGCRLVRWELRTMSPTPFDADVTLTSLSTDRQPASTFAGVLRTRSRWHALLGDPDPGQPPQATATASAPGLRIAAQTYPGDPSVPSVAPADRSDPLLAVIARDTRADAAPGYPGTVQGVDLDGQPQLLKVVAVAGVLPRALQDGVLVDLGAADAAADPGQLQVTSEVWLAPGRQSAVRRSLAAAGIRVLGEQRLGDTEDAFARETPARAAVADLAVAVAALVLLLALLAGSRVLEAGRRTTLWRVGRVSGLSRRRLARIVVAEVLGPAAAATVLGVVAGLAAIALAGTALPLITAGTVGPPLDVRPAGWAALAVTALVLGLVALVALVCGAIEAHRGAGAAGDAEVARGAGGRS